MFLWRTDWALFRLTFPLFILTISLFFFFHPVSIFLFFVHSRSLLSLCHNYIYGWFDFNAYPRKITYNSRHCIDTNALSNWNGKIISTQLIINTRKSIYRILILIAIALWSTPIKLWLQMIVTLQCRFSRTLFLFTFALSFCLFFSAYWRQLKIMYTRCTIC